MELRPPPLAFDFRRSSGNATKLRLIPAFRDSAAATLEKAAQVAGLRGAVEAHQRLGAWKANVAQLLLLAERNVLLLGLGGSENFHPENWAAAFRAAGERIGRFKDISVEVVISEEARDAVQRYAGGETEHRRRLSLQPSDKARAKGRTKKKNGNGEAEEPLDYVGPCSVEELIAQAVINLNIGAEAMETLKSKPRAKKASSRTRKTTLEGALAARFVGRLPPGEKLRNAVQRGEDIARAIQGARFIASLPGSHFHPESYERYARAVAQAASVKLRVFGRSELERMGAGGILAVGKGSAIPPRMIVLDYRPAAARTKKPILLVGKGVTFDTGGISLKPPAEMHEMKYDMCGSALALHAIALAVERKIPLPMTAILGIVENMPDGAAIKPGDVYTALNGLTIEVQNTDAEGRLVLGDCLAYACREYDPLCILDFATLTGACVIALGHDAAGLMSASEDLASRLDLAARKSMDRLWRLPHWAIYSSGLKSDTADLRNIAGRAAGTVTAMRFLSRFVDEGIPWAHLDIAGVAWRGKGAGSQPRGATAWGLRLMNQFVEDLAAELS